ncbi:MAG TPA: RidA family protein [Dehalococcoidia bacterium]|jgi:enamine deaminase RidA (YjgF/YER057c/UK114 family)
MERRAINPWKWQDNFGFVQANEVTGAQRTLICSGQTSVDENGAPLHAGDMAAQMNQALDNLETVLKAAGMSPENVIKTTIYTTDVDAFLGASMANRERTSATKSATTLIGVTRLAFPALMVEIEAIAVA